MVGHIDGVRYLGEPLMTSVMIRKTIQGQCDQYRLLQRNVMACNSCDEIVASFRPASHGAPLVYNTPTMN